MWGLDPWPGFGGPPLSPAEKAALGLEPGRFAVRVNYLVTWGPHAHTGRNAARAGIRKDDVVLSVAGVSDFETELHLQTWFRFTRTPGEEVEVRLLRDGRELTVTLPVVD